MANYRKQITKDLADDAVGTALTYRAYTESDGSPGVQVCPQHGDVSESYNIEDVYSVAEQATLKALLKKGLVHLLTDKGYTKV